MMLITTPRYKEEWLESDDEQDVGCYRIRVEIDLIMSPDEEAQLERLRRVYGTCPGQSLGQEVRVIK